MIFKFKFIKTVLIPLLILTIIFSSVSCTAQYTENEIRNIEYKTGLRLDIYQPTNRLYSKNPVVIYFHGGGWTSGDKSEISSAFQPILIELRENGITVVSADYSLIDESKSKNYKDCISDTIDCADWVFENAKKYDFDTDNISVMGYSAGAYLALMTAYYDDNIIYSGTYKNISQGRIKLCTDISGPVVFTEEYSEEYSSMTLDMCAEYLFDADSDSYYDDLYESSVLNNLDKADSGTSLLIYRCGDDDVVPEAHSNELYNEALGSNINVQYISFAGYNHFFENTDQSGRSPVTLSDIYTKISGDIIGILKK